MAINNVNPNLFHSYYHIRNRLYENAKYFSKFLKGRLLDFGCGSKPYKHLINADEYIGLDYYVEGHPHENEQIDVFYDGKNIPFANNYFDSILCSEVFEHVFNLPEILKELSRVLKPGGVIYLTCPFFWNEHNIPNDYARYTRFALNDMLVKNGFEIVDYRKSGNFVIMITQSVVLYFDTVVSLELRKLFFIRWAFKFFLVFVPNIIGLFFNFLLPKNDSVYLNNIILAKKV